MIGEEGDPIYISCRLLHQTRRVSTRASVTPVINLLQEKTNSPIFWDNQLANYKGRGLVFPIQNNGNLIGALVQKIK